MNFAANLLLTFDHEGATFNAVTPAFAREAGVSDAVLFAAFKRGLCDQVDAQAERLRAAVTTPGAGQAMEYQEAQAQAFTALDKPADATAARFPMLAASIGVDVDPSTGAAAVDVLGVARSVMAAYQAWSVFGAGVRSARLKGKAAIGAADTVEAAAAAFAEIAWPPLA